MANLPLGSPGPSSLAAYAVGGGSRTLLRLEICPLGSHSFTPSTNPGRLLIRVVFSNRVAHKLMLASTAKAGLELSITSGSPESAKLKDVINDGEAQVSHWVLAR